MKILFLNPQGNFDPLDSYWTQHPDFGGQLVYVKEAAKALTELGHEVDIITRKIVDNDWPGFESIIDKYPGVDNLRIIRISFGGDKFLPKEQLWPYINDFVDGIIDFYQKENSNIDFITSHYGDGGIAAAILSDRLEVPFSFTGHSLGAQKLDKMLLNNDNFEELNSKYSFNIRISAERIAMNRSAFNIVSTSQERFDQYSHLAYKDIVNPMDDNKFKVTTPGVNLNIFNENIKNSEQETISYIDKFIERDIETHRSKLPFIVASSRLEVKKNHEGIIKAYAHNSELQEKNNLMFVIRGLENPFKDYNSVREEEKEILNSIMDYINRFDLKGKVCFVDIRSQQNLATLYKYLSSKKSIFTLTSLYEPFGLAPLEAMACGLPAVVTKNGGPQDIFIDNNEKFGYLVDPVDHLDIAQGFLEVLKNWDFYKIQAIKRVLSKYTWQNTARMYLEAIINAINNQTYLNPHIPYIENIENFMDLVSESTLLRYFDIKTPV